jgi:hypothetical protein
MEKSQAQLEYDKKAQEVAIKLGNVETIALLMELAIIDSQTHIKEGKISFSKGKMESGIPDSKLDINGIAMKAYGNQKAVDVIRDLVTTLSEALQPKEVDKKKGKDKSESKYV